ncbi:MAG: hypothetical protein D6812_05475 [Deltaproteobacteria bacterium]|nr:MAG: hypothetical protein D6812_05475 [Deltaproteobacteria bacterium]
MESDLGKGGEPMSVETVQTVVGVIAVGGGIVAILSREGGTILYAIVTVVSASALLLFLGGHPLPALIAWGVGLSGVFLLAAGRSPMEALQEGKRSRSGRKAWLLLLPVVFFLLSGTMIEHFPNLDLPMASKATAIHTVADRLLQSGNLSLFFFALLGIGAFSGAFLLRISSAGEKGGWDG